MKKICLPLFIVFALAVACGDEPGDSATAPSTAPSGAPSGATASGSETAVPANASGTDSSAVPMAKRSDTTGAMNRSDTAVKRYFRGTGTEPFWSLSIDFTKSIIFKDVDGKELEVPVGKGEKAMDANVTRYASQGAKGNIVVQIAKQECFNEMSGQKFDYTVTLDIQENGKPGMQTYKGCGRYLAYDSLAH